MILDEYVVNVIVAYTRIYHEWYTVSDKIRE